MMGRHGYTAVVWCPGCRYKFVHVPAECHDRVEEALIKEFKEAHHLGSISRMRNCAETLLPFKVKYRTSSRHFLKSVGKHVGLPWRCD